MQSFWFHPASEGQVWDGASGGWSALLPASNWLNGPQPTQRPHFTQEKTVFLNNGGSPRINSTVPNPTFQHISPPARTRSGYVMTYTSHHTLPLKHIKELQKNSCFKDTALKRFESLGLTSLNGSFSLREQNKPPFSIRLLTFLQRRTETKAFFASCWCFWFSSSLPLRLNTWISWFGPLSFTPQLCLYEEKNGHVSFCGTHLSVRVEKRPTLSSLCTSPSARKSLSYEFIKSARPRMTKSLHRSMLARSS